MDYFDMKDTARKLGTTVPTLQSWRRKGYIKGASMRVSDTGPNANYMFSEEEIERFFAARLGGDEPEGEPEPDLEPVDTNEDF